MSKILLSISLLLLFTGCKKQSCAEDNFYSGPNNYLQILQVGYTDYSFMGGKTLIFNSSVHNPDSLPDSMVYQSPGDFGSIKFINRPSGEIFFDASIIWMGTGKINYPLNFDSASVFCSNSTLIGCPDSNSFQLLGPFAKSEYSNINYPAIWSAIGNLNITANMISKGCKIGLYRYTPSVGGGDPNQWSWIIFLYK